MMNWRPETRAESGIPGLSAGRDKRKCYGRRRRQAIVEGAQPDDAESAVDRAPGHAVEIELTIEGGLNED